MLNYKLIVHEIDTDETTKETVISDGMPEWMAKDYIEVWFKHWSGALPAVTHAYLAPTKMHAGVLWGKRSRHITALALDHARS
jgi:hypothetical protein